MNILQSSSFSLYCHEIMCSPPVEIIDVMVTSGKKTDHSSQALNVWVLPDIDSEFNKRFWAICHFSITFIRIRVNWYRYEGTNLVVSINLGFIIFFHFSSQWQWQVLTSNDTILSHPLNLTFLLNEGILNIHHLWFCSICHADHKNVLNFQYWSILDLPEICQNIHYKFVKQNFDECQKKSYRSNFYEGFWYIPRTP